MRSQRNVALYSTNALPVEKQVAVAIGPEKIRTLLTAVSGQFFSSSPAICSSLLNLQLLYRKRHTRMPSRMFQHVHKGLCIQRSGPSLRSLLKVLRPLHRCGRGGDLTRPIAETRLKLVGKMMGGRAGLLIRWCRESMDSKLPIAMPKPIPSVNLSRFFMGKKSVALI